MNRVVIGFGSNIEPEQNIEKAKKFLGKACTIAAESQFKWTKPVGNIKQADFINGSVLITTEMSLEELKKALRDIELSLGRDRSAPRYGPRTIDLDIVVWNDTITDKHFYERNYLKDSVLELIPNLQY